MNTLLGAWKLHMKTPIGTIHADYQFDDHDGVLHGAATGAGEDTPLIDLTVHTGDAGGQHVTWRQRITQPLRLNLDFDVTVQGDELVGESRAGRLPRTRVTGERQ